MIATMDCPPVLALVDNATGADTHWRIVRPFTRLQERGVDARWCWLDADEMPTLPVAGRVVVLQRLAVKGRSRREVEQWVGRLRSAGALAVVYEADDDIWSPAYLGYLDACGRILNSTRANVVQEAQGQVWAMQACDGVTVTTDALANVARNYTDAPVHVVPNAIDVPWFRERLMLRNQWATIRSDQFLNPVTIGWAGGRRPESDLEPMAVAWGRIARRYPQVRFVVAGWQHDVIYQHVDNLDQIIRVPWADLDDYPASYQVDIGCAIAPDDAFSSCKSPIKAFEYGMAGAAVVCSPLVYAHEIANGVMVAQCVDEWEEALAHLVEQPGCRQVAARDHLRHLYAHHDLTKNLDVWTDAYGAIVESRRGVAV